MNLTPSQIETIETYLLSWGLEYQDFYEEMLDHFMSDMEQRLGSGEDFEGAFVQTKALFSNKKFKGSFGLKAFETEYIHGIQKELKKKLRSKMKEQFTSWRIILWVIMAFYFAFFIKDDNKLAFIPFAIIVMIGMIVPMLFMPIRESWSVRSRWMLAAEPIKARKKKSLFRKTRMLALLISTVLFFGILSSGLNTFNVFFKSLGGNTGSTVYLIIAAIVAFVYTCLAWAQIELVIEELKRQKHEA
ncbi:hypothetical protein SAMN06298216_1566 [Spirosomataceae bacterium TFI 002]|nr:hypothetical protein SAMN06298216_1566 [Spirosomataceae bacterium TFI 002]